MESTFVFFLAFAVSVVAIQISTPIAVKMGLVDRPGGHKQHKDHVPLVGGIAIFMSVFLAWALAPFLGVASINSIFVAAGGLLFAVGLIDDRVQLSVKFRFIAQIVAALLLVYSKVILDDFGYILSDELFALGIFAIPVTVFAVIGVINAVNMIDGVDGLAGAVSLACLSLLLVVAYVSASEVQILVILCVMGALSGFLLFNMRWKGGITAKIYMGDAGSTLLGFLFAYLLISLSQGEQRAISPVAALWVLAVPLMDTVGVMARRIWRKKSPFSADRGHLHHLLLDADFRVTHVVCFMAALQLILGAIGLAGFYLGVSEQASLIAFLAVFTAYTYLISRPWRIVTTLRSIHRKTGLTVKGVRHVYIRDLNGGVSEADVNALLGDALHYHQFQRFEGEEHGSGKKITFVVIDVKETHHVKWVVSKMRKNYVLMKNDESAVDKGIIIRQYIVRDLENDRRCAKHHNNNGNYSA